MLFNPRRISFGKRRVIVCTLLFMFLTAFAAFGLVCERYSRTAIASSESASRMPPAAVMVKANSPVRLEAERVTLRATGFEPREITRPAGRFLLAVNDRSGQNDVVFVLMRERGGQLHRVHMRDTPRKHEWRQVVSLAPGRYVLSEAVHPDWTCRITLTGN